MTATLWSENLGYLWDGMHGFRNVTFSASPGEVSCIFGSNGSGKTTFLRVLSTLMVPREGSYHVLGTDAVRDPRGARRHFFMVPDSSAHFDHLSGQENVALFLSLYGLGPIDAGPAAAGFGLDLGCPAGQCSRGMRRKLLLIEAFLSNRPVLIFDEPTLGLDSSARTEFFARARAAADNGSTVIFSSNRAEDAVHATSLWIMEKGMLSPAASVPGPEPVHLLVTVSSGEGSGTEYAATPESLPELVKNILAEGIPRHIGISSCTGDCWTPEAREKISRAPRYLQHMITSLVERHAQKHGYLRITPGVIDEVKGRFSR